MRRASDALSFRLLPPAFKLSLKNCFLNELPNEIWNRQKFFARDLLDRGSDSAWQFYWPIIHDSVPPSGAGGSLAVSVVTLLTK